MKESKHRNDLLTMLATPYGNRRFPGSNRLRFFWRHGARKKDGINGKAFRGGITGIQPPVAANQAEAPRCAVKGPAAAGGDA